MSALIACRVTPMERKKLRAEAQSGGFESLSDFLRFRLGLPRGEGRTAPLPDVDAFLDDPTPEGIKKLLIEGRADDAETLRLLRHICNALKIQHTEPVHEQRTPLVQRQLEAAGFTR